MFDTFYCDKYALWVVAETFGEVFLVHLLLIFFHYILSILIICVDLIYLDLISLSKYHSLRYNFVIAYVIVVFLITGQSFISTLCVKTLKKRIKRIILFFVLIYFYFITILAYLKYDNISSKDRYTQHSKFQFNRYFSYSIKIY